MDKHFEQYLDKFEKKVIIPGIEKGLFGRSMMISTRKGKLDSTIFGKTVGTVLDCKEHIAVDYYGLIKKSSSLIEEGLSNKMVRASIVHFASIKIEYISDLASSLVIDFPAFKKTLIELRGFNNR